MIPLPWTCRPLVVALAALGVSSLVPACQEPLEIRYESEHLRIGTDFDEPLCRGDLDHLELVVTTAEAALAADVDKPIEVYLWDDFTWDATAAPAPASARLCTNEHTLGCHRDGTIYSSQNSGPAGPTCAPASLVSRPSPTASDRA